MKIQKTTCLKRTKKPLNEALPPLRLGVRHGNFILETLDTTQAPWHETPEEIEESFAHNDLCREHVKVLLPIMEGCLKPSEFEAMRLYYLEGKSYRKIGVIMNRDASTALRYVQRAIKKLRVHLGAKGNGEITLP